MGSRLIIQGLAVVGGALAFPVSGIAEQTAPFPVSDENIQYEQWQTQALEDGQIAWSQTTSIDSAISIMIMEFSTNDGSKFIRFGYRSELFADEHDAPDIQYINAVVDDNVIASTRIVDSVDNEDSDSSSAWTVNFRFADERVNCLVLKAVEQGRRISFEIRDFDGFNHGGEWTGLGARGALSDFADCSIRGF